MLQSANLANDATIPNYSYTFEFFHQENPVQQTT